MFKSLVCLRDASCQAVGREPLTLRSMKAATTTADAYVRGRQDLARKLAEWRGMDAGGLSVARRDAPRTLVDVRLTCTVLWPAQRM